MNKETMILGDLHISDKFSALAHCQIDTVIKLIDQNHPKRLVLLGDVFDKRKPSPEALLSAVRLFDYLKRRNIPTFVLRGNHDSSNKSDNGITALSLFHEGCVNIITQSETFDHLSFIPHYENQDLIKTHLNEVPEGNVVFGHFGYQGCLNSAGDQDFSIDEKAFFNTTFLGHIHHSNFDSKHVKIIGTPYTTSYQEAGKRSCYALYTHHYSSMEYGGEVKSFQDIRYPIVNFGPRHLCLDLDQLEAEKDFINDENYFTMLRVYLNQFSDANDPKLRERILNDYNIKALDIKFYPIMDDESEEIKVSTGRFSITDDIISDYVDANKGLLEKEELMQGLKELKDED